MLGLLAELEHDRALDDLFTLYARDIGFANKVVHTSKIDRSVKKTRSDLVALQEAVEEAGIPTDDGTPPPSILDLNPVVTPVHLGLSISNDLPPHSEGVEYIEWRLEPESGAPAWVVPVTRQDPTTAGFFYEQPAPPTGTPDTGPVPHVVKARVKDIWGRFTPAETTPGEPVYDTVGTFTPNASARYYIDLAGESIAGTLGFTSLAQLQADLADPEKDGWIITKGAMASNRAAFLEAWINDAYINQAMIATVSADSIEAGTIQTNNIFVASLLGITPGGQIAAGMDTPPPGQPYNPNTAKLVLDVLGLSFVPVSGGPNVAVSSERPSKITFPVSSPWGHIAGFVTGAGTQRGLTQRVDGASGIESIIRLNATSDAALNFDDGRNASITLLSAASIPSGKPYGSLMDLRSNLRVRGDLQVDGALAMTLDLTADNFLNPSGNPIADIVPLASLIGGNLPTNIKVSRGNVVADAITETELAPGSVKDRHVAGRLGPNAVPVLADISGSLKWAQIGGKLPPAKIRNGSIGPDKLSQSYVTAAQAKSIAQAAAKDAISRHNRNQRHPNK